MSSAIAHIDADSFFASVLVRQNPALRGKPVFALGLGGTFIIAASYEAKAFGVRTGMALKDARKLVPGAIEMASDFRETGLASEAIENILKSHCPVIEQMSIDEWYLDLTAIVGGAPADATVWARMVQADVLRKTDLSVSVGVGPSKLLAKMAGEYRKPAGVTVIDAALPIEKFLRDRPAAAIPGIGRQRSIHTEERGWKTAWDIATADSGTLVHLFGRPGVDLKRELNGEVLSPVAEDTRPPQSISRCRSFPASTDRTLVHAHLLKHLEYTMLKMRRQNLRCTHVSVWVRGSDYRHLGTHKRLTRPASTGDEVLPVIRQMLDQLLEPRVRYSQVGLALFGLIPEGAQQISLFEDQNATVRSESIQTALDTLHDKYGRNSVTRASALKVRSGTRNDLDLSIFE